MTSASMDLNLEADHLGIPVLSAPVTESRRVPEPMRYPGQTTIDTSDRRVFVLTQMAHPRIVLFGDVLSESECDELISLARPKLDGSRVVDSATGTFTVDDSRTSEGTYFRAGENPLVDRVDRRLSELVRWPVENGEGLQILHYKPGGEYRPHHDYFDPSIPGVTDTGGNRVATLILYLHSCDAGGWTAFPDVGFEVAPRKGHALFFSYDRPAPETKTLHAGLPVITGEKWIATRWMRERPYRS